MKAMPNKKETMKEKLKALGVIFAKVSKRFNKDEKVIYLNKYSNLEYKCHNCGGVFSFLIEFDKNGSSPRFMDSPKDLDEAKDSMFIPHTFPCVNCMATDGTAHRVQLTKGNINSINSAEAEIVGKNEKTCENFMANPKLHYYLKKSPFYLGDNLMVPVINSVGFKKNNINFDETKSVTLEGEE